MIELRERELQHVERFYLESKDEELRKVFPFMDNTLEEAIELFHESNKKDSSSYGRVIYYNGKYVGDVWCYCIDREEKSCFFSIVIFQKTSWGVGIGTRASEAFMEMIREIYDIQMVKAFSFKENVGSIRLMKKIGFKEIEDFRENGIESVYLEMTM